MNIAEVIGWKFNHQAGMSCRTVKGKLEIVEFPNGIPSKADQVRWTKEYEDYLAAGPTVSERQAEIDDLLTQYPAFKLILEAVEESQGLSAGTFATAAKAKIT